MEFSHEVLIDKPIALVWAYTNNVENLKFWANGYIGSEQISGNSGEPGSVSIRKYFMRGRLVSVKEEVLEVSKFEYLKLRQHMLSQITEVETRTISINENQTKVIMNFNFQMTNAYHRFLLKLSKNNLRKRVIKTVNKLKPLIESI